MTMTKRFAQGVFSVLDEVDESYFVEGRDDHLTQYCLVRINDDLRDQLQVDLTHCTGPELFVLYRIPGWDELAAISTPEDLFNYFHR